MPLSQDIRAAVDPRIAVLARSLARVPACWRVHAWTEKARGRVCVYRREQGVSG